MAPRAWFYYFVTYAMRVGFYHSQSDSSLFIFRKGTEIVYLLIYMDDIIIIVSSYALLQRVIYSLHSEFAMTDLGPLNYFLSIFATRISSIDIKSKLAPNGDLVDDPTLYRSLAGDLQYLTFTRPDIIYAVQQICLFMHDQREPHFAALKGNTSVSGVANVVVETAWLRNLLLELHSPLHITTLVYYDNISTVYLSSNPVQHQRTKYIEIDIYFVRDHVAIGYVRVLHVPSRYQYADIFTKGLPYSLFIEFCNSLIFRSSPAPTVGEY
ncbi:ribonuclease H-like domain-containing protein [Tanacetum coccineum]